MKLNKIIVISSLVFASACSHGQPEDKFKSNPQPYNVKNSRYPYTTMDDELKDFPSVNSILEENEACVENRNCSTDVVNVGQAQLKSEQIMVFEQFGIPWSAFLRYQYRISGFHKISDDGHYDRIFPQAKVSKPVLDMLNEINKMNSPVSKQMPNLGKYIFNHSQIEVVNNLDRIDAHSRTVFELMVDKNPDANFIFADNPNLSVDELCGSLNDNNDELLNHIQSKFNSAINELSTIIRANHVHYLNASFVHTTETEVQNMQQVCHWSKRWVAEKIVAMQTTFLQNLLKQNPEIILVQGVPNDDHEVYDCTFDRRWIRVGYATIPKSTISESGTVIDESLLPENLKPVKQCISVVINSGTTDKSDFSSTLPDYFDENSAFFNLGGLYAYPIDMMATSWATPMALSLLRQLNKGKDPKMVYLSVFDRIFDPYKNKQFIENK